MNILKEADKIVNERSEEKERAYGSFSEGMKRAASIASGMTGKDITTYDMFCCLVALKFSRESFNHKTDNLLDAVAYIGALNNFIEEEIENTKKEKRRKAKKKSVEIDFLDLSKTSFRDLSVWVKSFGDALEDHFEIGDPDEVGGVIIKVKTLEGTSYFLTEDDILIRGIKGEYYPCKKDIFRETYNVID